MYGDEGITTRTQYISLRGRFGSLTRSGGEKHKTYTGDARPENYGGRSSIQMDEEERRAGMDAKD